MNKTNNQSQDIKEKKQVYNPEKIGIKYTSFPDWDWLIDELVMLADEINKINEHLKNL